MKKLLFVSLALMMLASVAWGQHEGGTISGTVMAQGDSGMTAPLPFAHVLAFPPNSDMPMGMAFTDSLGHYTMHVMFGDYQVRAEAMHFQGLWYNNVSERSQATTLTVSSGNNPTGIDFLLQHEAPPPPPPGQGTISGTVMAHTDSGDIPFPYAMVNAFHPNHDWPSAETHTDAQGHYTLHVEFGDYQIQAAAMHFQMLWYNNVAERSQATTVTVDSLTNPTGIDFILQHEAPPPPPPGHGTISGTVSDSSGNPLGGIMVHAFHLNSDWPSAGATTHADGSYLLSVEFGNYQIQARGMEFESMWYNNVHERSQATAVTVDSTTNPTGINFILQGEEEPPPPPPPTSGISGMVTDAATLLPIGGAMIIAIDVNNHWIHFMGHTDSTGAYLMGVRPGEYIVQAGARGYTPQEYPTHVTVADSQIVTGINFALAAINFGSISGMVTDTAGAGIPGTFIEARRLNMPFEIGARTDSTGAYTIHNAIPGTYRVRAFKRGFEPGAYPDSVIVADGQAVTGINIVLGAVPPPFNGTIAGTITDDSTGTAIGHAFVVAIGDNGEHHRRFRYTFTADDGTFTLDGLSQVPYRVFAVARGYIGEFYNNVTHYADATPVTPNATGINFALVPGQMGPRLLGGRISLPGGVIPEGAIVYASINGVIAGITIADPDGIYGFEGIEPDSYDISVSSVFGDGQLGQPIDATFNDVGDVNIQLNPTSIGGNSEVLPTSSSLSQNYPNPFNAQTMISFAVAAQGRVQLSVYNVVGQKITTLVDANYAPGNYNVIWNGRDANGSTVSSGVYYYNLRIGDQSQTMKMTLLK
jgi:hypothetical protein